MLTDPSEIRRSLITMVLAFMALGLWVWISNK